MNKKFREYETIKNLLNEYFDAVYKADVEKLKSIFHKDASMNGFLGDDMVIGTPDIFYQDLQSKPSMEESNIDCSSVVKHIEVNDKVAQATLYVDNFFGVATVIDQFHLIKCDDEWKIICKTFTTL